MVLLEANALADEACLHRDQALASSKAQIPRSRRSSFESAVDVLHVDYKLSEQSSTPAFTTIRLI